MSNKAIDNSVERNYGVDLLRCVSMFMVVILHVLGFGGVLDEAKGNAYSVAWLLEIICYCAVNCFALITGYVSCNKRYRISRYISTWLQVSFYSFFITLLYFLLERQIGIGTLFFSAFPVFSHKYWFFTAYTGMFLLIPIMNQFIQTASKKLINYTIVSILIIVSVYNPLSVYIFGGDPFSLNGGYSFIWLSLLYLVGAWLNENRQGCVKNAWLCFCIVLLVIVTWIIKLYSKDKYVEEIFVSYCSPTIIWISVFMVMLFSGIRLGTLMTRLTVVFSPSAFSVYLIHVHPIIYERYIEKRFIWIASEGVIMEVISVLGCAFVIFLFCLLVDIIIRKPIFKVLRVDAKIKKITTIIEEKLLY